jgi:hypothetical protein
MLDDTGESHRPGEGIELGAVTASSVVGDVRFETLVNGWGFDSFFDIPDDIEHVVIDEDQVGGVAGCSGRLGHHRHDRVARHERCALNQGETARDVSFRIWLRGHPNLSNIIGGDDGPDPGHFTGCLDIDSGDSRVRKGASDESQVERARRRDIVDETGGPPDEGRVFAPLYSRAEE